MADRSSAEIFGIVFRMLADDPDEHRGLARRLYGHASDYDFTDDQMNCDDALMTLGLARKRDGEIVYGPVLGTRLGWRG